MPRCKLFKITALHIQKQNCGKGVYELEDHVAEKALSLNLLPKFGHVRKILHVSFPNHLLENV